VSIMRNEQAKNRSMKRSSLVFMLFLLLSFNNAIFVQSSPIIMAPQPIFGLAEYCNGGNADGAYVEVSSTLGSVQTLVGPAGGWGSGYWQIDVGNPGPNWPVGTSFTVIITQNSTGWQSTSASGTISVPMNDMGTIILDPPTLTASANADKTTAAIGESIHFSGLATGGASPYVWGWDFGDGSSSTAQNPTHSYSSVGSFTATLTVTGDCGKIDTDTITITVSNPVIVTTNGPYNTTVNDEITFIGSAQGGTSPYTYFWDFGDDTNDTNASTTHTYATPGIFTVILTVEDVEGIQGTAETTSTIYTDILNVNAHGPYDGTENIAVQFYGSASNGVEPYTYSWNFGDGTGSSNEQNPSYTYSDDGNFTVTLTVTDDLGTSNSATTFAIIEKPPYLSIDIGGPYIGVVNDPVNFTLTVLDGKRPYTVLWDFGDGTTSSEENPSHSYSIPGQYLVTVHVTDDDDRVGTADTTADIDQNYPPAKPSISGTFRGQAGDRYTYTFRTNDPDGDQVYFFIDWGDGTDSGWIGPYTSGKNAQLSHVWRFEDSYVVKVKAKDTYGAESGWTTNEVVMPILPPSNILIRILEHIIQIVPILEPILNQLIAILSA
jgi:PKD repeat protein